jgi:hypothetical protein
VTLRGRLLPLPSGRFVRLLRWVSGYALLAWGARLLLAGLGFAREIEVELLADAIRTRGSSVVLGRSLRATERLHPLSRLDAASRTARYPSLYFLVGTFCFAAGVLLGGLFAFDAARTGDRQLWMIAAAFVLGGSGLDLVLESLLPGARGRVVLDLDLGSRHRLRVAGVSIEEADRFLHELERRLSRGDGGRRALA